MYHKLFNKFHSTYFRLMSINCSADSIEPIFTPLPFNQLGEPSHTAIFMNNFIFYRSFSIDPLKGEANINWMSYIYSSTAKPSKNSKRY